MALRRRDAEETAKFLEVDASMQGSLIFRDPVNLQINGRFEGSLQTRGHLIIGERAQVRASIEGDDIVVAGQLDGDVRASERLEVRGTAKVAGTIITPRLLVHDGAIVQGQCNMAAAKQGRSETMNVEELAQYLEVDARAVLDWAGSGRLPGTRAGDSWVFDRTKVDAWVANEKIR